MIGGVERRRRCSRRWPASACSLTATRHLALAVDLDRRRPAVPKAIVDTGMPGRRRRLDGLVVGPADRRLAVGHQHDAGLGRRMPSPSVPGPGRLSASWMASSAAKIASPMAVPSASSRPSMASCTGAVVGGRRHLEGRAVEADEPDVERVGEPLDEARGRLLGGLDAVGRRRRRPPSTATCRWPARWSPAPGDLDLVAGWASSATTSTAMASDEQAGGEVAAPARAFRRDLVEQLEVGEAHGVVGGGATAARRRGRPGAATRHEQPQPGAGYEERVGHRMRPRGGHSARRRRTATKRTRSSSQSRSVRSTRWSAPAPRMRAGDLLALLGRRPSA